MLGPQIFNHNKNTHGPHKLSPWVTCARRP